MTYDSSLPPGDFDEINQRFESLPPDALLRWAFDTFAPRIALATGFGPSGVALMHMVTSIYPDATVFYIETDLHFPETYTLRDQLAEILGIRFVVVHSGVSLSDQDHQHGTDLWTNNPDYCCQIRKVEPLKRFLAANDAWITGIRRDQAPTRAHADLVQWDDVNHLIKINPLVSWTSDDVWSYVHMHRLPYNRLHDQGYPSIGCMPCTRAVSPGEDQRAGRWSGRKKTECGIHTPSEVAR